MFIIPVFPTILLPVLASNRFPVLQKCHFPSRTMQVFMIEIYVDSGYPGTHTTRAHYPTPPMDICCIHANTHRVTSVKIHLRVRSTMNPYINPHESVCQSPRIAISPRIPNGSNHYIPIVYHKHPEILLD